DGVNRDELHKFLGEQKVPSMIYYPIPAHRQNMFAQFNSSSLNMPVTDWLTERVISLPIHTELDEEQLNYITGKVLEFVNR
ncbi:MAG TPA: DegT/DnrJ/EryC1/StrS family aminotransferase, partial [Chitinophagaceae bacterium]